MKIILMTCCLLWSARGAKAQLTDAPEHFDSVAAKMNLQQLERYVNSQLASWEATLNRAAYDPAAAPDLSASAAEAYGKAYRLNDHVADSAFREYIMHMVLRQEEMIDHRHSAISLLPTREQPEGAGTFDDLYYVAEKAFPESERPMALRDTFSSRGSIKLATTRLVDSLQIKVSYTRFADIITMHLDAVNPQRAVGPRGATLKKMEGKEVLLELTDSLSQCLMKVEGLNASGIVLEPYSFASSYRPATVWLEQIETGMVALRQVRINMQAGLYATADAARAAIRSALPAVPPGGPATQGVYKHAYVFRGTVAAVRIYYQVGSQKVSRQFVLRGPGKKLQQEDEPLDIRNR